MLLSPFLFVLIFNNKKGGEENRRVDFFGHFRMKV